MSRSASVILLIIGILLSFSSCAPFGYVIYKGSVLTTSEIRPISEDEVLTFQSTPFSWARFAIQMDIYTGSVQEDPEGLSLYIPRFSFPVTYTVIDSSGNSLIDNASTVAWEGGLSVSTSNEDISSTGGTLTVKANLPKFLVPADGKVNIDVKLSNDRTYEAEFVEPGIILYEDLIDNTWYVVGGITLFLTGIILSIVGFIFLIIHSARVGNQEDRQGKISEDNKVNQKAMIIQLSAFSGYIIPFGNIIIPFVLWQVWKDYDQYINDSGREAVNFQLTMLFYYVISFVLLIILIGIFLMIGVFIFHLSFTIIGSVKASQGINYRYPLTIRLIK